MFFFFFGGLVLAVFFDCFAGLIFPLDAGSPIDSPLASSGAWHLQGIQMSSALEVGIELEGSKAIVITWWWLC